MDKKFVVISSEYGAEYWVQELGNGKADLIKRHSKDVIEIKDAECEGMASKQAERTYAIGEEKESTKDATSNKTKIKKKKKK